MVKDEAEARQLYARLSRLTLQEFNVACDLLGWIPRDPALREAVARCQMVVETAPQSASAQAFTTIAHRLIHCTTEPARVKGGLQFFLPSLMAAHLEETR
jgi:MinD-like ATPase involved in chromosome partitioning or flagellar assembly